MADWLLVTRSSARSKSLHLSSSRPPSHHRRIHTSGHALSSGTSPRRLVGLAHRVGYLCCDSGRSG